MAKLSGSKAVCNSTVRGRHGQQLGTEVRRYAGTRAGTVLEQFPVPVQVPVVAAVAIACNSTRRQGQGSRAAGQAGHARERRCTHKSILSCIVPTTTKPLVQALQALQALQA